MKILVDTNIFLEIILEREKAEEAKSFLSKNEDHDFFISDFSLHTIGILFFSRKQHNIFLQFLKDLVIDSGMMVASLVVRDMENVINVSQKFKLDFDDAYQYTIAEKDSLIIVSFDADFDRTPKGRRTPNEF